MAVACLCKGNRCDKNAHAPDRLLDEISASVCGGMFDSALVFYPWR